MIKYKVGVKCYTYNQAAYIEDTLHGFALQETSYPVVFCIVDDASNDGESFVIKDWAKRNLLLCDETSYIKQTPYGEVIFAPSRINSLSTFAILLLKENHHKQKKLKRSYLNEWLDNAEYWATCEGDDYWVTPDKLQRQVDFLDSHPDYVLCYTDFDLSSGAPRNHSVVLYENDNYFPGIINGPGVAIGTLTVVYRVSAYNNIPKLWLEKGWPMGDQPLFIELSREGKFKYLPVVTAHYRTLVDSASHGSFEKEIAFIEAGVHIRKFYSDYYGLHYEDEGLTKAYYVKTMKCAFKHNNKNAANTYLKKAIRENRTSSKMWLFYIATVCKPIGSILKRIRQEW